MDKLEKNTEDRDFTYSQILREYEHYLSYRDKALHWGLIGLLAVPFTFMVLLFFMPSRVVFLALWIVTFIGIAIFLSYTDYKGYYYRKLLNIDEDEWRKKQTAEKDRLREVKIKEKKEKIVNKLNSDHLLKESKRKKKARRLLKKRHKQRKKQQQKLQLQQVKERQKKRQQEEYKIMRNQFDTKLKNIKSSGKKVKRLKQKKSDDLNEEELTHKLNIELNGNQNDSSSEDK